MNKKRIGFFIFVLAFLMIPKTVFAAESCSKIGIDKNKWEYSKTIKNAGNEYKDEETSSQKVVCCKKGSGSLEHMECDIYKKKTATNDTDKDKDSNSNSDNSSDNNSDNSSNNQDATSNPLTGVQCKTAGEKVDKNKWKFKKYIYDLNDEYETGDQGTEYYACCKIGQGFIGEGANRKVCDVYELVDPSASNPINKPSGAKKLQRPPTLNSFSCFAGGSTERKKWVYNYSIQNVNSDMSSENSTGKVCCAEQSLGESVKRYTCDYYITKEFAAENGYDQVELDAELREFNELQTCEGLFGVTENGEFQEESFGWIIQKLLNYIKIAGPILVILFSMFEFAKAIVSSDDDAMKKAQSRLVIRLVAVVALFLLPFVVGEALKLINGMSNPTCYFK